jgi:hypothetical protein
MVFNEDEKTFYFECPHCEMLCQVLEADVKCRIFRHAVYKRDMTFVHPHAPKEVCDALVADGLVWGCGKPFQMEGYDYKIVKCGYI